MWFVQLYLLKRLFWGKRSILSLNVLSNYMLSQVQRLSKLQYRFRSVDALQRTTTGVQLSSEWPAVYIGNSFWKDQKIFPKTTTVHCFCDRFWPFLVFLWSTIIMETKQFRIVSCEFRKKLEQHMFLHLPNNHWPVVHDLPHVPLWLV